MKKESAPQVNMNGKKGGPVDITDGSDARSPSKGGKVWSVSGNAPFKKTGPKGK